MREIVQSVIEKADALPSAVKIAAAGIVVILLIIAFVRLMRQSSSDDGSAISSPFGGRSYQNEILQALPNDARLDYSHLFKRINEVQRLIQAGSNSLDAQRANAANQISQKIAETQRQIDTKWGTLRNKAGFYHYISLHYASFTLADSIKREQEVLRGGFVQAKRRCEQLSVEIERLNREIASAHGQHRYKLMQQHKQTCATHKRISQMRNLFGQRNTEYLEMVRQQNAKTRQYRKYIIRNCGAKGRAWGRRLARRKADQVRS